MIFGNISKIIKNENNIILTTEEKLNTNPIYNQNNYARKNYKTHTLKEDIYYFILYWFEKWKIFIYLKYIQ